MRAVVLVSLVTCLGCVDASDPIEPQVTSGVIRKDLPMFVNRQLDILFVIDDSPAMAGRRDQLQVNFRRFITVLRSIPGGLPDLHLGVVTTDLGTRGGPAVGACAGAGDDGQLRTLGEVTYLVDTVAPDGTRLRNYDGELADAFAKLADVGSAGCAFTQPLAAARRAFENPGNRGFLREGSSIGVFVISANDDCSFANPSFLDGTPTPARCADRADQLTPIGEFERFFKALTPDPARVVVGGALGADGAFLAGQTRSFAGCATADTRPDGRLRGFLDRFPNRSSRVSLCDADLSALFAILGQLQKTTLGAPCFDGPLLDRDLVTPGVQPECALWYEFPIGGEVVLPCGTAPAGACYRIIDAPQICPFDGASLLKLEQPRGDVPEGSHLILECVTR